MSFFLSNMIRISQSLSSLAVPLACEPKSIAFPLAGKFFARHSRIAANIYFCSFCILMKSMVMQRYSKIFIEPNINVTFCIVREKYLWFLWLNACCFFVRKIKMRKKYWVPFFFITFAEKYIGLWIICQILISCVLMKESFSSIDLLLSENDVFVQLLFWWLDIC